MHRKSSRLDTAAGETWVTVDHLVITAFRKFDVGIWNLIRTVAKGEVSLWGWGKHGILIYIYS